MKTPLEEVFEYLDYCGFVISDHKKKELMNKQESIIIKAYDDAFNYVVGGGFVAKTGEQYFEEMYGTTNKETLK